MLPLTPLRVRYPSGKDQQFYHKVERYRQGVVFEFVTVGLVARFDIAQFVLRLAIALSLLAMAKTITEVVGYRFVSAATRKVRRVVFQHNAPHAHIRVFLHPRHLSFRCSKTRRTKMLPR